MQGQQEDSVPRTVATAATQLPRQARAGMVSGRVALVTGGTRGIGAAIGHLLAAEGASIAAGYWREREGAEKFKAAMSAEYPDQLCTLHKGNIGLADDCRRVVHDVIDQHGRLDILVNNAGVQHVSPIEDFPPEKWDQIIAINLTSAFHATRAAVPIMKRQGRGRIVNIASAHALVASPFKSAYVAAKHGVLGLTRTVALEVAQAGITCNAICPGYVKTALVERQIADQAKARGMSEAAVMSDVILAAQPTKRFVEFDQLAGMLLYLVSDLGASANGAALSVDGGWTAA
jgi:3-hydroxybutyrate dehydrogenase